MNDYPGLQHFYGDQKASSRRQRFEVELQKLQEEHQECRKMHKFITFIYLHVRCYPATSYFLGINSCDLLSLCLLGLFVCFCWEIRRLGYM